MNPWKNVLSTAFLAVPVLAIALASTTSVAQAAIVMEKMLLAETPDAFEKGVSFPLRGESGAQATYLSVRVYKWSQTPENMYSLEPTDDFAVFPEMVRISADSRRTVAIKATRPLPRDKESHYRIILREFDRADEAEKAAEDTAALGFQIRPQVSLPMIVRAPASVRPGLMSVVGVTDAPASSSPTGEAKPSKLLRLRNDGPVYQRVLAIGVNEPAGETNQRLLYLLPGQIVQTALYAGSGDRIEVLYTSGPDAKADIRQNKSDDRQAVNWIMP